jgi:hypothetical protein
MSDASLGEIIRPLHYRLSVSADRKEIAVTFQGQDAAPVTFALPLLGAAGLQRKLAQSLYLLGVRPVTNAGKAAAEPAAMAG